MTFSGGTLAFQDTEDTVYNKGYVAYAKMPNFVEGNTGTRMVAEERCVTVNRVNEFGCSGGELE